MLALIAPVAKEKMLSTASFSITTLGCKVNQYDSSALGGALVAAGLTPARTDGAPTATPPELLVINTCCVTVTAMRKSRNAIRRAVSRAPDAAILITGCYSDYDRDRLINTLGELGIAPQRVIVAGHHEDTVTSAMKLLQSGPGNKAGQLKPLPHRPQALADALRNEVLMNADNQVRTAGDNPPADTFFVTNVTKIAKRQVSVPKNVPKNELWLGIPARFNANIK